MVFPSAVQSELGEPLDAAADRGSVCRRGWGLSCQFASHDDHFRLANLTTRGGLR
jgi:hypothetical protein